MKTLSLELNSAFLQRANSADEGAVIALGLALDPPTGLNEQAIQFLSVQAGDAHFQLRLETTGDFTPIPEVSSLTLCGVTILAAWVVKRRRDGRSRSL